MTRWRDAHAGLLAGCGRFDRRVLDQRAGAVTPQPGRQPACGAGGGEVERRRAGRQHRRAERGRRARRPRRRRGRRGRAPAAAGPPAAPPSPGPAHRRSPAHPPHGVREIPRAPGRSAPRHHRQPANRAAPGADSSVTGRPGRSAARAWSSPWTTTAGCRIMLDVQAPRRLKRKLYRSGRRTRAWPNTDDPADAAARLEEALERIAALAGEVAVRRRDPRPPPDGTADAAAVAAAAGRADREAARGARPPARLTAPSRNRKEAAMAQVTVKVNGYTYTVGCEDGQELHLQAMATQVDSRVESIKALGGNSGEVAAAAAGRAADGRRNPRSARRGGRRCAAAAARPAGRAEAKADPGLATAARQAGRPRGRDCSDARASLSTGVRGCPVRQAIHPQGR